MNLSPLAPLLRREPAVLAMLGGGSHTVAVSTPGQAITIAGLLHASSRRPVVVVTATGSAADAIAADLALLGDAPPSLFPAWETLPFERVSPELSTMAQRLRVLGGLEAGTVPLVVAPVKAVMQRLGPWRLAARRVSVAVGDVLDLDGLTGTLVSMGYRREHQVEHRGELARRGGILDVFDPAEDEPVRIDLFGDTVERVTRFDVASQRSTGSLDAVEIGACRELVLDDGARAAAEALVERAPWGREQWVRLAEGETFDGMESWMPYLVDHDELLLDLIGEGATVVLVDPRRIRDRAGELLDEEHALAESLAATWGVGDGEGLPALHLPFDRLLAKMPGSVVSIVPSVEALGTQEAEAATVRAVGWEPVMGDEARLAVQVAKYAGAGYATVLTARSAHALGRLADSLAAGGVTAVPLGPGDPRMAEAGVWLVEAALDQGVVLETSRLALLGERDLTGRRRPHRVARARARAVEGFFDGLEPGSYVVHRQHGTAVYRGMVTRTMGGATRDYLLLEYRGDDRLYLPTDQIDALTPYSGGEHPHLNRLGGNEWAKTRAKARAAVHEIAEELVELYRARLSVEGFACEADTPWQHEMEQSFPFVETDDQLTAIADVKADMEAPRPMDRLICGDVGFGKTEVAIRAVFKEVQNGRQAAVLVPTTLLASQHHQTLAERFGPYPVRVELLSRFLTDAQAAEVLAGLAEGNVDVVVGTHRLLGADVAFKRLGLLVVDEEQRFGVTHKEAIKAMAKGVDVLTLTASPIPRTLEMALTGIRDLSMVNTPPVARRPILTHVGEYDEAAVAEAIRRELLREGQVFYVHNRVRDIDTVAARVARLVPDARVAVAHGQMDEGLLEKTVYDFWEGGADVLVCTTIIESGIDMPTVNTLVVDRADQLGLGQLHQLRGRVGRGGQRAYAYLFHPPDVALSETAYERLRTIGDHTELGSGFKIALRDLQIRGAGNLLGRDQSGHVAAVGYDLYVQMVSEAVAELKGEAPPPPVEIALDLPDVAHLPPEYVPAEDARLEAYRRLSAVREPGDVDDVAGEWLDRYGPIPPEAEALLAVARLRVECLRTGVREIAVSVPRVTTSLGPRTGTAKISPIALGVSAQVRLSRIAKGATYSEELGRLVVPVEMGERGCAPALVELLAGLVPAE